MPQSATITVLDKQKVSDKAKAPYKIETSTGDTYKAWPDVGQNIHAGETYNISYEIKVNGEYSDRFIKVANKSTEGPQAQVARVGQGSGASGGGGGVPVKPPVVDWAAKEEDMATLAVFKAVWTAGYPSGVMQCLDDCRMEWRAHKDRMKAPKPAPKTMETFLGPVGDTEEF